MTGIDKLLLIAAVALQSAFCPSAFAQSGNNLLGQETHPLPKVVPDSSLQKPGDVGLRAHTNTRFTPPSVFMSQPDHSAAPKMAPGKSSVPYVGPPFAGFGFETPGSLACLHGLVTVTSGCNPNTATTVPSAKGGKAIAIVDAYHYPTALADLQTYSTQFGLPAPVLKVYSATSAGDCNGPTPTTDPTGWEGEAALDIQMAHAAAPQATIILVEAQSSSNNDLLGAVRCANTILTLYGGGELSMSWGGSEFSGQNAFDTYFSTSNVVYFASSGDMPGVNWPSSSAKVISVGGMSYARGASLDFLRFATWTDGGGGLSNFVTRPTYQDGIAGTVGARRGVPDISAVANPDTGVWVFDSNPVYGTGWYVYGGTSVAAAFAAGLTNAAGGFRASTAAELTALYAAKTSAPASFSTTSVGFCGPYAGWLPGTSWNPCVGLSALTTPLAAPPRSASASASAPGPASSGRGVHWSVPGALLQLAQDLLTEIEGDGGCNSARPGSTLFKSLACGWGRGRSGPLQGGVGRPESAEIEARRGVQMRADDQQANTCAPVAQRTLATRPRQVSASRPWTGRRRPHLQRQQVRERYFMRFQAPCNVATERASFLGE